MKKHYSLFLVCSLLLIISFESNTVLACSVITTENTDTIWFGYNEDRALSQFNQISYIKFHKSVDSNYAFMEVTAEAPGLFSVRVGMNEKGVAISGNSVPLKHINAHPEKQYSWKYDSFYQLILQKCSNITEVINLVNNFEFKPDMNFQVHIADENGSAIVVSPGNNGEVVITQKNELYMISTNANRAEIEKGLDDIRNNVAISVLNKGENLGKDTVKSTLNAVHQESYEGCTFYSTIFDLKNRIAYFYLMHNFNEERSFNITKEFLLGDHYYLLTNFFPDGQKIIDQEKNAMQFQEQMFLVFRGLAVILILIVLGHFIYSFYKNLKLKGSKKLLIQKIGISIGIHSYLVIFLLLSASAIPAILFTDFLIKSINMGIFDIFLTIYFLICIVGIMLFSIWVYSKSHFSMKYAN